MDDQDRTDPYRDVFRDPGRDPYRSAPVPQVPLPADGLPPVPGHDAGVRPRTLDRLHGVMRAGAVAALLQGVHGAFVVGDLLAESTPEIEQAAAGSGLDAETLLSTANAVAIGVVAVSTVLSVGLWLVFARLLDQGRARTGALWLGVVNGTGLLLGVVGAVGLLEAALTLLSLGLVVAGLVLLWSPVTAAWFRAVAATRTAPTWD